MSKTIVTSIAGGVVVSKNGLVALVNQNNDSWSLPKGHVEIDENALDAAIREIAEETGITQLNYIKNLGSYERFKIAQGGHGDDKSELKQIQMFLFRTTQQALSPSDPSNPEAKWVEINNVCQVLSNPKDCEFFEQVKPEIIKLINRL